MSQTKCKKVIRRLLGVEREDEKDEVKYAVKVVDKILSNVLKDPENDLFRSIKLEKPALARIADNCPTALKYLEYSGFELKNRKNPKYALDGDLDEDDLDNLTKSVQMLRDAFPHLDSSFNPYRSSMVCVNPAIQKLKEHADKASGGKGKTDLVLDRLKLKRESLMESAGIPSRHFLAFPDLASSKRLERKNSSKKSRNKTSNGPSLLAQACQAQKENAKRRQQFNTKSMRELELLQKAPVYTRTLLRVQFPDKSVLQAFFSPLEKISDVVVFFSKKTKNASSNPLYLFQTPPKREFQESVTLEELKLAPSAMIYAGFRKGEPEGEVFKRDVREMLDVDEDEEDLDVDGEEIFGATADHVHFIGGAS